MIILSPCLNSIKISHLAYLLAATILLMIWFSYHRSSTDEMRAQVDPRGDFSGMQATKDTLKGIINEVKELPE